MPNAVVTAVLTWMLASAERGNGEPLHPQGLVDMMMGMWLRAPRSLGRVALLLALGAVPPLSSCGTSTGPTASENVALMAHFDSLAMRPTKNGQLAGGLVVLLALGAPVQHLAITLVDSAQYSAVAALEVGDDTAGHPIDSIYEVIAWRDDSVHTIVDLQISGTTLGGAWATDTGQSFVTARADWNVTPSSGRCASFVDRAPPGVRLPTGERCMRAVGMLSVPSTMENFDFIEVGLFGINAQTLASIRLDAPPQPFRGS